MRRPDVSELAAACWIASGLAATAAVQARTAGSHSVTAGLRRHPAAFTTLAVVFSCHVYGRPRRLARYDPFHAIGWLIGLRR